MLMPLTKTEFMREQFADLSDEIVSRCYDAILQGDLHEVARLIGKETTQGILDRETDEQSLQSPLMDMEKILDDKERARDINETNRDRDMVEQETNE